MSTEGRKIFLSTLGKFQKKVKVLINNIKLPKNYTLTSKIEELLYFFKTVKFRVLFSEKLRNFNWKLKFRTFHTYSFFVDLTIFFLIEQCLLVWVVFYRFHSFYFMNFSNGFDLIYIKFTCFLVDYTSFTFSKVKQMRDFSDKRKLDPGWRYF